MRFVVASVRIITSGYLFILYIVHLRNITFFQQYSTTAAMALYCSNDNVPRGVYHIIYIIPFRVAYFFIIIIIRIQVRHTHIYIYLLYYTCIRVMQPVCTLTIIKCTQYIKYICTYIYCERVYYSYILSVLNSSHVAFLYIGQVRRRISVCNPRIQTGWIKFYSVQKAISPVHVCVQKAFPHLAGALHTAIVYVCVQRGRI